MSQPFGSKSVGAWLLLLISAALPVATGAQSIPPSQPRLDIGVVRRETLPVSGEADAQKDFLLSLPQGATVRIDVASESIDPEVQVFAPGVLSGKPIAANDDFGSSLNARVRVTAETAGDYRVKVIGRSDLFADESAAGLQAGVEILVARDVPAPPPWIRPLIPGTRQTASFAAGETNLGGSGLEHIYTFDSPTAQRLVATVDGSGITPRLSLRRAVQNGSDIDIVRGEMTRDGSNVKLVANIAEPGSYQLLVSGGAPGEYALTGALYAPKPRPPETIVPGQERSGTFSFSDPETAPALGETRHMYQEWVLTGRPGQRVRLEMCSDDEVDPLLQVVAPTLIGDKVISSNDDTDDEPACGNEQNSRLDVLFTEAGSLRILASPLRRTEGAYTLTARELSR